MTFRLIGDRRNSSKALAQRFEIGRHIGGLLSGKTEIGHIGFRLHRGGRFNPMNEIFRVVLKFAANKCAARHLTERRTDYSIGAGYSGNNVAGAAPELFDGRLPALWRTGNREAIAGSFVAAGAARQQSATYGYQACDERIDAHTDIRCGLWREMFSAKLLISGRLTGITGWSVGLVFAALLAGSACFCQQGASPPDGRRIFSQYCAKCHGADGEGISASVTYAGPSLQAEHNAGNVMMALEVGPQHMPRFEYVLSGDQMRAVSQFVAQTLAVIPLTGGNVSDGGELYRTYCVSCHGPVVRGGALGFAGANAPSLVNKSAALLAGAIRWGPGPMPSFPPSVLADQQVASIVDYIRVVQTPPNPGGNPLEWFGPTSEGFTAWVILLVLILFAIWAERGGQG